MSAKSSDKKESSASPDLKDLICAMCRKPFSWPRKREFCPKCADLRKLASMREANRRSYWKYVKQTSVLLPRKDIIEPRQIMMMSPEQIIRNWSKILAGAKII